MTQVSTTTPEGLPGNEPVMSPSSSHSDPAPPGTPAPPSAFDWNSPIPVEGMPSDLEPLRGKSFNDFVTSYRSMRQKLSETGTERTTIQTKLEEVEGQLKTLQEGGEDATLNEKLHASIDHFYDTGSLDADAAKAIMAATGIDQDDLTTIHQAFAQKRAAFVETAVTTIGGESSPESVHELLAWLNSGQTHYSNEEIISFERAAKRGKAYFMTDVAAEYQTYLGAGGVRTVPRPEDLPTTPPANIGGIKPPFTPRNTVPTHAPPSNDVYSKRSEFTKDLMDAVGDPAKEQAAIDKMEKTPDHIKGTSEFATG